MSRRKDATAAIPFCFHRGLLHLHSGHVQACIAEEEPTGLDALLHALRSCVVVAIPVCLQDDIENYVIQFHVGVDSIV